MPKQVRLKLNKNVKTYDGTTIHSVFDLQSEKEKKKTILELVLCPLNILVVGYWKTELN